MDTNATAQCHRSGAERERGGSLSGGASSGRRLRERHRRLLSRCHLVEEFLRWLVGVEAVLGEPIRALVKDELEVAVEFRKRAHL